MPTALLVHSACRPARALSLPSCSQTLPAAPLHSEPAALLPPSACHLTLALSLPPCSRTLPVAPLHAQPAAQGLKFWIFFLRLDLNWRKDPSAGLKAFRKASFAPSRICHCASAAVAAVDAASTVVDAVAADAAVVVVVLGKQ